MQHFLLFATTLYALPILRPLARAIRESGGQAAWFVAAPLKRYMAADERILRDIDSVRRFAPGAVFSASNWVPHFFPGIKVQVFHGFNVEKRSEDRGHFRIRGLFDLYCTQGPATTLPFQELASEHGHFAVVETGWPKLDPLFVNPEAPEDDLRPADGRPVCMYAATFTEGLSSARALYREIAREVASGERYWLLTLHPKCDEEIVARYRALAGPNARYLEAIDVVRMMRAADILLSDTSSVVSEFVVQGKPVVTFRNRAPKPHMIDIAEPRELDDALRRALAADASLKAAMDAWAQRIHPYRDGRSSERVLEAARSFASRWQERLKPKPRNLLRNLKGRLRYHRWVEWSAPS
jgi:CDP-glycerol glycerophosphotransferase (TagB/SpsB family)